MVKKLFLNVSFCVVVFTCSFAAKADTLFLKPGQCVIVGAQQVCAQECTTADVTKTSNYLFTCRYGRTGSSDVGNLKTYALFRIETTVDGRKIENMVKDYGPTKKDACEKDAEDSNNKQPK